MSNTDYKYLVNLWTNSFKIEKIMSSDITGLSDSEITFNKEFRLQDKEGNVTADSVKVVMTYPIGPLSPVFDTREESEQAVKTHEKRNNK